MKNSKEKTGIDLKDHLLRPAQINLGGWSLRGLVFLLSAVLVTLILFFGEHQGVGDRKFVIGDPSPQTLFSPFEIVYDDEIATEVLRQKKSQGVPSVYKVNPETAAKVLGKMEQLFQTIQEIRQRPPGEAPKPGPNAIPAGLTDASVKHLIESENIQEIKETLQILLEKTFLRGVLPDEVFESFRQKETGLITVIYANKSEEVVPAEKVLFARETLRTAGDHLPEAVSKNRPQKKAILEIFNSVFSANLALDQTETDVRKKKAAESVLPVQDTIKRDELIIQRGRLITPKEKQRIDAVQSKSAARQVFKELIATGILVTGVYLLAFVFFLLFERRIMLSWRRVLLIQSVFLLTVGVCKAVTLWPASSPYLMPTALASLLFVLLIGPRPGMLAAIVMTVITAPMSDFQMDIILATLVSSMVATFSALHVRKRLEFLKVGFSIGAASALVLFAFQFYAEYTLFESFHISLFGLANGLLIIIPLCFLVLPLFEAIFQLTTDITLLELSDLNHPLLKRMIVEAPGTYHHSLVVSSLAEYACESIGANALLARVGCYFHDIGKLTQADYFTENMGSGIPSKHDQLTPRRSFETILNHVRGGLELGRQYKLREPILRFIPEHHGTGVVWYFYKKAVDHAKPGDVVQANEFRYPGPKPQSRETAVALLADSTEAASRSLKELTPDAIRHLVRKIINDKFIDGQLDECDLTLRDLHRIQESFVQNLMAIYHTRISYPAKPEHPDKTDLFESDQFSKFRSDPHNRS